jgi:hypothetical protein
MNNYKKVELAQASVDGVKVDGLDTNLAVMKVNSEQKQHFPYFKFYLRVA